MQIFGFGLLLCVGAKARAQEAPEHEQPAAVTLEAITVTAKKLNEYIRNHPQQVTVVDRNEILERHFLNVEETLNSMPGIEVKPSAGIGSRISIRGSGKAGGVLVLLNGRPLNSSQYGGVDLSTIPIDIVKSVTVFKPPVPVWLGSGASEGAISILTHDFKEITGEKKKTATRVKVSGGSYGRADAGISHSAPLAGGNFMITAAGAHQGGKRTNADKDKGDVSIHWDRNGKDTIRYEANGRYYLSDHGSPGRTDKPTPDARQHYEKGSLDVQAGGLSGETGDYCLKAYADGETLRDEAQSGVTSDIENLKLGLKADTTWSHPDGIWSLRFGAMIEKEDMDHTLSGEHHRVTAGAHGQYDHRFGPVVASLGLRGDHTSDLDFNPGATGGLSVEAAKDLIFKGNAGYAVKVPTFGQLYQPSHGSIDQVRGNPDLQEEKVVSCDLGLEYRFRKDRVFQATLFRTETRDLIVYRRGTDLVYQPVNIDEAWRHGIAFTTKYTWNIGLSLNLSYILQDSENLETGKELAYTPRHTMKATFKYTLPGWETRLEINFRHKSERYSEAEARESEKLDDYATLDFKLLQPFTRAGTRWEGYLNLYNLFDQDFENHYGYPDDGFRLTAGFNLSF